MAKKIIRRKAIPKAGPYIKTARAKKRRGRTVRVGGTQVLKPTKKGQQAIGFEKGGLHKQLGVPQGTPIPAAKRRAALAGKYGPLAKKRAVFAFKGALAKGRKTVAKKRAAKRK